MIADTIRDIATTRQLKNFADWRRQLDREQVAPVIAVAGSRGKTSVVRATEAIFNVAGLRFASWTNRGVEIEGEGQRGELGPWSRALMRLRAGGLDVALRELDWATVQAIGAIDFTYPVLAVANLCGNSDACMATQETLLARKALARIKTRVPHTGTVILNSHDLDLAEDLESAAPERFLVGISPDAPIMRRHLELGGDASYVEKSAIMLRECGSATPVVDLADLPWIREGSIQFAVQNALMATAIARSCGISVSTIAIGLQEHRARAETMPGSFNVFECGSATIVVDRPMASWFLRPAIRAVTNLGPGRQVRLVGPMASVATDDLSEVGRLLGRHAGVLLIHGEWDAERWQLFRQGVAANEVPPLILQAPDERLAIQQGLDMLRAGDMMLILAENAPATVRLLSSRARQPGSPAEPTAGAA
jgi:cyanophycin synthetase